MICAPPTPVCRSRREEAQTSSKDGAEFNQSLVTSTPTARTRALTETEAELNDRFYRLFDLSSDEINLLQKEVEH